MAALRELQPFRGAAAQTVAVEAIIRAQSGDATAARVFLRTLESRPDAAQNAYALAAVHMAAGDREAALQWLRTAAERRSSWVSYLAVDPIFIPLRETPEFADLLTRLGLRSHAS